jgi:NAD(P)-dependent dehydrogenase (short-subunit alcohol dehydrogenase family)
MRRQARAGAITFQQATFARGQAKRTKKGLGRVRGVSLLPDTLMQTSVPNTVPRAALISGGAKRIGRAITLALVRAGYAVAVHANKSGADAEAFCSEIAARGGRAATVRGDLADHDQVRRLVQDAAAALGPLTLLVNNASVFEADEIATLERAGFDRHLAINLRAPLFLAQAFAAQAPLGANASIVNVLDQRVLKPTPLFFSYALSKNGLFAATTMLAQALAPKLRVNAVAPGPTLPSSRQSAEAFAKQAAALPLGRGPTPEQVAEAVLYLAGADTVTGQTIAVDGGQHLAWQTPDAAGIQE